MSPRSVLLAWSSLLFCRSLGVVGWKSTPLLGPSFMLITCSVVLIALILSLVLPGSLLSHYVRSVGHDVSPGKCVLLSTSKAVRKALKTLGFFW